MTKLIDLESIPVKTVLRTLLKDKSTNKNIIFATDVYDGIQFTTQITEKLLLGEDSYDIQPRVSKSQKQQAQRTRKKAEVFTPSWICNKMNNLCDTEWFGHENVFNTEQDQDWIPNPNKIKFPKGKTWKDYVNSNRLEITCGEAPYIVSRYDATTGEIIPIEKRIGILDRKLRVINDNVKSHRIWNSWVYRAFESVYGYEFQGDNLLIARINLLETFCDYTRDRWNEEPSEASLKRIANIISWNIWQMDGIHRTAPYSGIVIESEYKDDEKSTCQMSIFDFSQEMQIKETVQKEVSDDSPVAVDCKIYDWRNNEIITYKSVRKE